jgi:hypothetical protein
MQRPGLRSRPRRAVLLARRDPAAQRPTWRLLSLLAVGCLVVSPAAVQCKETLQLLRYQQKLEAWFQRLDRDGDGRLTPAEVRGHPFLEINFDRLDSRRRGYLVPSDLAPKQHHFLGNRVQEMFRRADTNRDGRISPAEAAAFPWLWRHFTEADRNRDGSVTLEELWWLRSSLAPGN